MREILGMTVALLFLRVQGSDTTNGVCVDGKCFTVHTDRMNFPAAQRFCEENRGQNRGHLMTVRSEITAGLLSDLLTALSGDFWLGLRYAGDRCSNSAVGLKGYTWITGDNKTHYINFRSNELACSPRCVSVSKPDYKWTERQCNDKIEGFLCEYANTDNCQPLPTESFESVLYETPFGFSTHMLKEIPIGTNGTIRPLGTRHICLGGSWLKAPWSCEVSGGGCDYKCVKNAQHYTCICQPGYKIANNSVTCTKLDDPCVHAGCEHECSTVGSTFLCKCPLGFELGADGKTCKDINECNNGSVCPGANKKCVNTVGGFQCDCQPGFMNELGVCVDVDECETAPCEHECINTEGSYSCVCFKGYIQSTEDIHKCNMHCPDYTCPADCDYNTNTQCNCPNGFVLEDDQCVDIDECENGNCDQECRNLPGSFECFCKEGFQLIENGGCDRNDFEGSGASTPFDIFIPTSRSPTIKPVSGGHLLGMICTVVSVVLLVCLVHYIMRRRNKMHHYNVHKGNSDDFHDFQQVVTEKNSKQDTYFKRDP